MGYVIRMPQLGMSMDEGTVVEWTVEEGDAVEEGDTVAVVESEKASADVDAREDGVLLRVVVPESGTVEPGDPIGILGGPDEDLSAYEAQLDGLGPAADDAGAGDAGETAEAAGTATGGGGEQTPSADAGTAAADVRATPGAKRAAREAGVDLTAVEGTGPGGVVTEDDVREAGAPAAEATTEPADAGEEVAGPGGRLRVRERRDLSGAQQSVSDRLGESYRNAVHVTLNRRFDTTALDTFVDAAKTLGVDVSYTDLLVKAVGDALVEHPAMNAHYTDDEHVLYEDVNVGVAVDADGRLVTPVLTAVPERGVRDVTGERRRLTDRVTEGTFTMDDLEGGTFTVTNLGMFGVDHFDPVINPPQVGILGVGRRTPDASMVLSLSFDHRVVNGAGAARFLDAVVGRLTDEESLGGYFR
jgi:pyruvate dehydrogenase E2 component (dihydrolipoamide acetyltransferase)